MFGYLFLAGTSRCCKTRIPVRYLVTEVALASLCSLGAISPWLGAASLLLGGWTVLFASRRLA